MNKLDEDKIFMAYEESYGYLAGTHIRDKDGISTSMLMCQMAAYWKAQGKTLIDVLDMLYEKHGHYIDEQISFVLEGAAGAERIAAIMERLRNAGKKFLLILLIQTGCSITAGMLTDWRKPMC